MVKRSSLPSLLGSCFPFRFNFALQRLLECRYLLTVSTFGMKAYNHSTFETVVLVLLAVDVHELGTRDHSAGRFELSGWDDL
jgi:hypothetical protein